MRDMKHDATPYASAEAPASELRGSVLDVVRALLAENDSDAILEIVSKLVAENADMSRRLAQVKRSFKTSEKIGRAQLVLFVDALARGEGEPESDDAAASSACQPDSRPRPRATRRQPAARTRGPAAVSSLRGRAHVHRP